MKNLRPHTRSNGAKSKMVGKNMPTTIPDPSCLTRGHGNIEMPHVLSMQIVLNL